jgi:hypothetical protein
MATNIINCQYDLVVEDQKSHEKRSFSSAAFGFSHPIAIGGSVYVNTPRLTVFAPDGAVAVGFSARVFNLQNGRTIISLSKWRVAKGDQA